MRRPRSVVASLVVCFVLFCSASIAAGTGKEPLDEEPLPAKKEARIAKLVHLKVDEAFEALKDPELFVDKRALDKAVRRAFEGRRAEAIARSLEEVRQPTDMPQGEYLFHNDNFDVAKHVLKAFEEESIPSLLSLYANGDGVTRGNVIQVAGAMGHDEEIRPLLLRALDDVTPWDEQTTEPPDQPMRVCDIAYNQIVLRYNVKDVLRTTGKSYTIEERDTHIQELKEVLRRLP